MVDMRGDSYYREKVPYQIPQQLRIARNKKGKSPARKPEIAAAPVESIKTEPDAVTAKSPAISDVAADAALPVVEEAPPAELTRPAWEDSDDSSFS